MFLDGELANVRRAKRDLAERTDLRRHVAVLEVMSLRARLGRTFSRLNLGLGLAGKALELLKNRHRRRA